MKFQKFESDSFCVGGRHHSATKNLYGDESSKESTVINGFCSLCNRKKSMPASDNTIQTEGLGSFFNNLGKISTKAGKKLATNALKNQNRSLEVGTNVVSSNASRNLKKILSTLFEVIYFYHTGKGLYLGKLVQCMLNKWKKKQIHYTQAHHLRILF